MPPIRGRGEVWGVRVVCSGFRLACLFLGLVVLLLSLNAHGEVVSQE